MWPLPGQRSIRSRWAPRQEVDHLDRDNRSKRVFARKIQLTGSLARKIWWPAFWPPSRFLNRQLGLSRALHAAVLAGIVSGLGACERSTQSPAMHTAAGPSQGGTLTVAVRTEPRSFCSCIAPEATAHLITLLTQARLVRVNQTTEDIEPWIADSWTRSDDGLRYIIKLKPNVLYSDATPMTADDVVL